MCTVCVHKLLYLVYSVMIVRCVCVCVPCLPCRFELALQLKDLRVAYDLAKKSEVC